MGIGAAFVTADDEREADIFVTADVARGAAAFAVTDDVSLADDVFTTADDVSPEVVSGELRLRLPVERALGAS